MTHELTYRNHFRFGYNQQSFNDRRSPDDRWWVTYGRCEREPLGFREECIETAKLISRQTKDPIWILFSGGVDCEVTLRSFREAGVPCQAAIARFRHDLNVHDISYAVICCESLGIPYRFFELDLLEFWEGDSMRYASSTRCVSPQLLTTMWLADQVDGYPVLGSGECYLVKRVPPDYRPGESPYPESEWDLWEKEKVASWYRHFLNQGRAGCPGFFQYTPELMLSFLRDPKIIELVHDRCIGKLSTMTSKLSIYQKYFELISRPKYTGFEKVQEHDQVHRAKLYSLFGDSDAVFKTSYAELIRKLSPRGEEVLSPVDVVARLGV